jgi:hypothetical protein
MHGNVEQQARQFAYLWFRRNYQQATDEESRTFAADSWPDFVADVEQPLPEDEPVKLVDLFGD